MLHDLIYNIRRWLGTPLTQAETLVTLVCTDIARNPKGWKFHHNENGGIWNIIHTDTEGNYYTAELAVKQHYTNRDSCKINNTPISRCQYNKILSVFHSCVGKPPTKEELAYQELVTLLVKRRQDTALSFASKMRLTNG